MFVDFPETLHAGRVYSHRLLLLRQSRSRSAGSAASPSAKIPPAIPGSTPRAKESGASIWWPNKDQWRDEVENMQISVAIPNDLVDVSNGKFMGKTDLGDGYTRWDWLVHYPINNYDVSLNIGNYVHFSDRLGNLPLDFYVLPEDLDKAKKQFAQAKGMLEAYQHYFGEYPFQERRLQVDRSALFRHGAPERRHLRQPFRQRLPGARLDRRRHQPEVRLHHHPRERATSGSATASPPPIAPICGFTKAGRPTWNASTSNTRWGKADALKYINAYKPQSKNQQPIISPRGVNRTPPEDQYFKGALFLNTLRSVMNDDKRWLKLIHDFYQHFKYQNIMTEDVVQYFNQQHRHEPDADLQPISAPRCDSDSGAEV